MGALLTSLLPGGDRPLILPATGAAAVGGDPFDSGMWPLHREAYLGKEARWSNDPAIAVLAPKAAENSAHVPFLIDATALPGRVDEILVTVDYSPFAHAMTFRPGRALPFLGFAVKYEVAGALRASARIGQDWHVGAAWVSALGGGCSAPSVAHARPDWQLGFGEMRARIWPETGRLRVNIRHPQDTGLADGVAAHFLTELFLLDADGAEIAALDLFEPLEENPSLTFLLPQDLARGEVTIRARDNLGNGFRGKVSGAEGAP
ncbi:quinoprotein dehydrogenase-associated SoxYZ-like carrier [Gemmobacter serpentinus]|uniref:quinoprotein dehydrogenase-associated SoxYZ-like carrier n=1 Tax=Gemmobacter serpentinus TaxID=2652247 RepID=UPI00124C20B7|nr:quinoprotein dehydrogenase-associated SoxYZ-like carrier [Gemmobacter serpentinus]